MYSLTKNLLKTTHRNLKKIDINVEVVMDALKKVPNTSQLISKNVLNGLKNTKDDWRKTPFSDETDFQL